jgi:hypothetical protein
MKKRIELKRMHGTWHSIKKKLKDFGLKVDHAQAANPNERKLLDLVQHHCGS